MPVSSRVKSCRQDGQFCSILRVSPCANCKPPHTDTVVSFSVTIASDFSWSLTLYGHTIEVVGTDVLHGVPVILSSVKGVCTVISALQESSVCVGNVEQKYITLIEHNKCSMKSSSGTVKMRMFSNQINPKFNFTPCRLHPASNGNSISESQLNNKE